MYIIFWAVPGAQVAFVLRHWLDQNHPDDAIQDFSIVLDKTNRLRVRWDNDARVPFVAYVDLLTQ